MADDYEQSGSESENEDPSHIEDQVDTVSASAMNPTETMDSPQVPHGIPKRIGQYHIKRAIASGGMGTVYEATQEKPRRTVALKLMRIGLASRSALRRFEYESQLLARLRHPGIAQVYDAGTHRDGEVIVPYFAMEYIPGAKTVYEFVNEKKLRTRERLELFAQVCDAVHHGHQKGVIHRDLKPGNILVDSNGQVKVIDFGVARSTDSDMAVTTLQTNVGQLIGTLQYMSPEQCKADPHDLDTRSDVYALGVVLFQVLSGRLPYDISRTAIYEATRVIREQQPTHLSVINKTLRGDVETIVMKALEKDRDRRYQSASELADDIRRFLNNEPIAAHPASMLYQLRVFARRNKGFIGAIVTIFVVLVSGVITSSIMYVRAEHARTETYDALTLAENQRAQAQAVTVFLSDTLSSVDPASALGREITVREMLESSANKIQTAFNDQPMVEAALRSTIGNTYRALGIYQGAESHLRIALELRKRELPGEHLDVAESLNNLAGLLREQGEYDEAEKHYREALVIRRGLLGNEHTLVAVSMNNLALLFKNQGRYHDAEQLFVKTLALRRRTLGEKHPKTLHSMNNLAVLYTIIGRTGEALPLHLKALDLRQDVLGADHPDTLKSMNNLANLYRGLKRLEEAEQLYEQTVQTCRRVLGKQHPHTLIAINNFARTLMDQGKLERAATEFESVIELAREALPTGHWHIGVFLGFHGECLIKLEQYKKAESSLLASLDLLRDALGTNHSRTVEAMELLVTLYETWSKPEKRAKYQAMLPK